MMVKLRSFRLRIALLSVFLAGSALAAFSVASWLLIYDAKLKRLDGEIKSQLLKEAVPPRPPEHWQTYSNSLAAILGLPPQAKIGLWVINSQGQTVYQSEYWSAELQKTLQFPQTSPTGRTQVSLEPSQPGAEEQISLPPLPLEGRQPSNPPPQQPTRFPGETASRLPLNRPKPLPGEPPAQLSAMVTQPLANGTWRIGTVTSPFTRIAIAVNLAALDAEMSTIQNGFLITVPAMLLLVAIGAWILAGSALAPLQEVTAKIQQVTAKGLDQRILIGTTDVEFVELLQVFNQMMERLERSFKQASRFSADAAHELKTPLAILQGELERSLQQVDSGSELQQRLSNLLDEVRRLGSIVRKLLLLSLADAGQMQVYQAKVDLSKLLADLEEDIDMLAPNLEVQMQVAPSLTVLADPDLLVQVLQNLITNAIKYNLPQGWIQIEAHQQQTMVWVTIRNASQDIPASDRPRIFDRFHRVDPTRNRKVEGLGLGLSLSREIARAHKGNLVLDQTPPGQTSFTLTLPISRV